MRSAASAGVVMMGFRIAPASAPRSARGPICFAIWLATWPSGCASTGILGATVARSVALLVLVLAAGCATAGSSRDVLRDIVLQCLDPEQPRYCARCRWPQAGTCDLEYPCTRTTEVWAQTQEYVAIRDIKMCGCPAGFVHGLAMPRYPVSGAEDWRRPDGIWRFGWEAARGRIG